VKIEEIELPDEWSRCGAGNGTEPASGHVLMTTGSRPTVSVALCTHNGETFISEQVASILGQTVLPLQIVLSDDASADGTVQEFTAAVERATISRPDVANIAIVILRNERPLGVTKNFEQAISHCVGDMIALSDQDDVWVPHRLKRMGEEFAKDPELLLLFSDSRLVDGGGLPLGYSTFQALGVTAHEERLVHDGRAMEIFVRRNLVTGATTVFRKKLFEKAAPFPGSWVHDEWLGIVAAAAGRVDFLAEPLVDYRQHASNEIGAKKLTWRHYIGRIIFPRTERNARLYARAENMAQHPFFAAASPEMRQVAVEKLQHEMARQALPAARLKRIGLIFTEVRTGAGPPATGLAIG
jgi:glycosyltransferase involved in cell wall biosynthesis